MENDNTSLSDKENYYLFTLEVVIADDPPLEILEEHLKYYEEQEEYLACAGIKLGIEFAKCYRLVNLTKQLKEHRDFYLETEDIYQQIVNLKRKLRNKEINKDRKDK